MLYCRMLPLEKAGPLVGACLYSGLSTFPWKLRGPIKGLWFQFKKGVFGSKGKKFILGKRITQGQKVAIGLRPHDARF